VDFSEDDGVPRGSGARGFLARSRVIKVLDRQSPPFIPKTHRVAEETAAFVPDEVPRVLSSRAVEVLGATKCAATKMTMGWFGVVYCVRGRQA
jgi:hypothetical protein